jgi:Domain of Unknown Function (DUF748)
MDEAPEMTPRRRWPRRVAIGFVIATAVFAVLGFFVVPPVAKSVAQKQLGELLGRKVVIDRIRVNPFALSLTLEGFRILEADGTTPFVGFKRLYVNAELSSVFRRAPVIKEVSLESLRVHVVRVKSTSEAWADVAAAYNFSDIVARLAARPKAPEPPEPPDAPPPRFSLNNLRLVDGAVTFDDRPLGGHHEITDLAIGVPFVSTLPVYLDSFVEPGLSVRIDGTPFSVGGRTKPFGSSLETVVELRLQALDLTKYVPFVPLVLPFAVDGAKLSLALDVAFARPASGAPRLTVKGNVALDGLDVRQKHESGLRPMLHLEKLAVEIGESDVGAQHFVIDKVLVAGLDLHVQRLRDGTLNLQHLAPEPPPEGEATRKREREEHRALEHREHEEREAAEREPRGHPAKAKPEGKGEGPRFSVGSFVLERAVIHFRDETTTPTFETEVRDFDVAVKGLSNAPGVTATTSLGLRAVPGAHIVEHGTLRLTPLEAKGHVAIEDIEPARFAPYYHDAIAFDVSSGRVKVGAEYRVEEERKDEREHTSVRLAEALVDITDLGLRRRGAHDDFFHLGGLAVHDGKVDLDAHTIAIPTISTHDGKLRIVRDEKGVVDLTTLVPPAPPAARSTTKAAASPPPAAPPSPSWTVTVDKFDLDKWGARLDDRAVTPHATLTVDPIALHVTNLSTAPGSKAGLDLRLGINKTGRLQITGPASFQPVAANVRFDLRTLEILPLQPYFRDQESLTVTDGTVSLKGHAAIKLPATGDPQLTVTTDIDIADVSTVDRAKREPLVDWKSFHVGGLKVSSPPLAIAVDDVSLTDFDARLILFPDAHLNLQEAFAAPGATTPAAPPSKVGGKATAKATPAAEPASAPGPDVKVGQVTLQGGDVTFSDRSIHPGYTAELTELAGRVSGLSSKPGTTADIDLRGSVNRSGALAIVGRVNPLAKDLFADVQVTLRDFDLPPASPYAGKYAGYAIGKGKLDLSLDYKIAGGKLDAKNRLVLDQFTFGDKVASPDAVKLPVRLAIALLKDRRGVIDINLPIAGSLADPEFKVWHAVLKVLGNLVVKAVTAPFSLIASAFGGGDELSRIDFPPGLATLDATAKKRLGALTKAMQERPGISFELEGDADPGKDRDSLRRYLYERKLKKAKMVELVQGGVVVASADELTIEPAERDALLSKSYAAAKFPKPTNALGIEKSLPRPEQEKLMLSNTRVEDDQLTDLALRRATAVENALAKATANGASRLFLVTPRLGTAGGHVELTLKKD